LRGYNVKVNGLFDVTPDNGQPVREIIPPLDDTDFALMQKSGVNVLRLPVSWSAFEPQQGQFVPGYLAAIDAFLNQVRPYGFYVLLDFHEDGWSKDLCEDGAPAWATVVTDWAEGGTGGSTDCHVSTPALSAHTNFFDNDVNDLQAAFATMYQQFAAHFVNEELVFAYEIFNEPISSDPVVDAFSIKVATAIRQVDSRHLILWEPSALRNQLNEALISSTPFPVSGCVYAVHVYTTLPYEISSSIENALTEAQGWGEPLFVTEHGANPLPDGGIAWVDDTLNGFDQTGASSMDWIWNPGVITRDDAGGVDYVDDGGVYAHLTRPYAMAIGGDVDKATWDGAKLTIAFHDHPGVPAQHDVYWNRGTPSVTCDGAPASGMSSDPTRLVFHVPCGVGATAGDGGAEHSLVFGGP
jgi:Cellulase (glycosyl hydrolase family 5)